MAPRRQRAIGGEARTERFPRSAARTGATAARSKPRNERSSVRKLVELDRETWQAVDLLGRDAMMSFRELTDEAFRDLLHKHGRSDTLRGALKRSAAPADGARPARSPARMRR